MQVANEIIYRNTVAVADVLELKRLEKVALNKPFRFIEPDRDSAFNSRSVIVHVYSTLKKQAREHVNYCVGT